MLVDRCGEESTDTGMGGMASAQPAFGSLLRRYRLAAGLTQEELAEGAGLSVRGISDLERGLSKAPRLVTLRLLLGALHLTSEERAALRTAAQEATASADAEVLQENPEAARQALPTGGFLGSLPRGPFVARETELSRILAAMDAAREGIGTLVVLTGEPGVGKTRLAQEVTLHAHDRDFLVAAGRCYEPERAIPYYPFLEALDSLRGVCPPALQEQVSDRWPYLARLLSDYGMPDLPVGRDAGEEQQRLLRAVTGFVAAVAEISPVAILLDDLQWVDRASLSLLLHLVRSAHSSRLFVLGTYRDAEVDVEHPMVMALRDLEREQLVERVRLARMDGSETTALMGATLATWISEEFAAMVYRRTEGNPFFVQQLLRTLVERGDVYWHDGDWARREIGEMEVPEGIQAVIGQRLARLSAETRRILQEASVLGRSFVFDDLQEMSGREEIDVEEALDQAARAGLLYEIDQVRYGFDHALTQEALYTGLSSRLRARLHLAAGEALERFSGPTAEQVSGIRRQRAAELAWHFLQGRRAGQALDYYTLAGDEAETVYAHAEAERHYRTALSLARELDDPRREAEALEKLGGALRVLGKYDEAHEHLEAAVQRYGALTDAEGERRTVAQIGRVLSSKGLFDAGVTRLQAALGSLAGTVPTEGLAALHVELAFLLFHSGRYDEQLAEAERACEASRAIGSDRLLAQAELIRGYALVWTERRAEFRSTIESVLELSEKVGDLPTTALALGALVEAYADAGDLRRAMTCAERALTIQEQLGDQARVAFALYIRGLVAYWSGSWETALADFEQSLELYREVGPPEHAMIPTFGLGLVHAGLGDWEAATCCLEEHMTIARRTGDLRWFFAAEILLAEREVLEGRLEGARIRLERTLELPGLMETDIAALHVALSRTFLELGDEARAAELVAGPVRLAEDGGDRRVAVEALRVQGMVLARQGRWEDARRCFERVLSLTGPTLYPYWRARALYEYGAMLGQQGEEEQARVRLAEALSIFEGLGAKDDVERTRETLTFSVQS